MEVDAATAIAFVAAIVAYIEVRVRQAVENATAPLPKRRGDRVVPRQDDYEPDAANDTPV